MKVTINIDMRRVYPLGRHFDRLNVELRQARQRFHMNAAAGLHDTDRSRVSNFENYNRDLAACCEPYGILMELANLIGPKALKVPMLRDLVHTSETGRKLDEPTFQFKHR